MLVKCGTFETPSFLVLKELLYKTTLWISMYFEYMSIIVVESELNYFLYCEKPIKDEKKYLIKNNTVVKGWHWRLSEVKTVVQIGMLSNKEFKLF